MSDEPDYDFQKKRRHQNQIDKVNQRKKVRIEPMPEPEPTKEDVLKYLHDKCQEELERLKKKT